MTETTATRDDLAQHHAMLADDRASEWLGIEVEEVAEGRAVISMTLREEMLNGFGIAHGGMVFAFADTAFAMACNPPGGSPDTITVAAGADITFTGSGIPGRRLTAIAERRHQAGRSGLYDVQVRQSLPELPAAMLRRYRTSRRPAA